MADFDAAFLKILAAKAIPPCRRQGGPRFISLLFLQLNHGRMCAFNRSPFNTTMKTLRTACACFLLLLLTACLVPEHFAASVDLHADGSYAYAYNGTVVHAMAAAAIKQSGKLSARDENGLKDEADKLMKVADVKKASYTGNARYDLRIEGAKKPGETLRLFDFFTVTTDKDGVITITSPEFKEKDKRGMEQLGIKVDGTLEVKLPRNAEIISQNATSSPTFFGLFGGYSWKIGKIDQRPLMKIRLKH